MIILILFLLIGLFLPVHSTQAMDMPADYAMLKNPFNPSDKNIKERGKWLYTVHCSKCHGEEGDGKGPLSEGLNIKPFKESIPEKPDGYLVWVIENGKGMMPDFGPGSVINLSREDIWKVITFIRGFARR